MSVPQEGLIDEGNAIEYFIKIGDKRAQEADFMTDIKGNVGIKLALIGLLDC